MDSFYLHTDQLCKELEKQNIDLAQLSEATGIQIMKLVGLIEDNQLLNLIEYEKICQVLSINFEALRKMIKHEIVEKGMKTDILFNMVDLSDLDDTEQNIVQEMMCHLQSHEQATLTTYAERRGIPLDDLFALVIQKNPLAQRYKEKLKTHNNANSTIKINFNIHLSLERDLVEKLILLLKERFSILPY